MSATADLSIVTVTHNGREMALDTIASARAAEGDIVVQWIVVDSGSTDGTPDAIAERFPDILLVRRPNIGFAAANNVGFPHATGRYVLLLNPDMAVERGTFGEVVAAMDARPGVGAASVIQLKEDGTLQRSIRHFPTPLRALGAALMSDRWPRAKRFQDSEHDTARYHAEASVDWVVGAFLMVRRNVLDEVGMLDERFFLYAEEADWCYRIRAAGWEIRHLPVMRLYHYGARRERPELVAQLSHSHRLFADKHFGPVKRRVHRAVIAFKHAVRVAAFGLAGAVRPALRDRAHAEAVALRVTVGLLPPPFRGPSVPR